MSILVNLNGSGGNAHALIALVRDLGRQCCYSRDEIDGITSSMRHGSYADLLDTLERSFPGLDFDFRGDPRRTDDDADSECQEEETSTYCKEQQS